MFHSSFDFNMFSTCCNISTSRDMYLRSMTNNSLSRSFYMHSTTSDMHSTTNDMHSTTTDMHSTATDMHSTTTNMTTKTSNMTANCTSRNNNFFSNCMMNNWFMYNFTFLMNDNSSIVMVIRMNNYLSSFMNMMGHCFLKIQLNFHLFEQWNTFFSNHA